MTRIAGALLFSSLVACASGSPPVVPAAVVSVGRVSATTVVAEEPSATRVTREGGEPVEVEWHGRWWPAVLLERQGDGWLIHYEGYGEEWDEVVPQERIRPRQTPPPDEDDALDPDEEMNSP